MITVFGEVIAAMRRHSLATATAGDVAALAAAQVRPLCGGRNNAVFAADLDGRALCLKCYRVDERRRDEREWQVLSALHDAGCALSPTPYLLDSDPVLPIIVMERLPGDALGGQHLGKSELTALAQALQSLYRLPPEALPSVTWPVHSDARARLGRVRAEISRLIKSDGLTRSDAKVGLLDEATLWLSGPEAELLEKPTPLAFSRGDPNLANCLWDGEHVRIVDYEYGGWSDRAFDLADLVEHVQSRGTPDEGWEWFIEQFSLSPREAARLAASRRLLGLFWLSLHWPIVGAPAEDQERFESQRSRAMRLLKK